MNSSRRWLIVFTIVIVALVIATISLVILTQEVEVTLLPEDTPQGIVQRYLIAIQKKDFQQAYTYISLSPLEKIKSYDDWLRVVIGDPQIYDQSTWKAILGKTTQNVENATIEVTIDTFRSRGPFESPVRSQQIIFQLSKINSKWVIISPIYVFWIY